MKLRLIKTIRFRDLIPRPYFEIDENLILRIGIEIVIHETILGVEGIRQLSGETADRILPWQELLREKKWMI